MSTTLDRMSLKEKMIYVCIAFLPPLYLLINEYEKSSQLKAKFHIKMVAYVQMVVFAVVNFAYHLVKAQRKVLWFNLRKIAFNTIIILANEVYLYEIIFYNYHIQPAGGEKDKNLPKPWINWVYEFVGIWLITFFIKYTERSSYNLLIKFKKE